MRCPMLQGGGKRKGAFAIYLEPWHADIWDWLDLRKNHGKEENRCRDLFYGLWVNDLFMEARLLPFSLRYAQGRQALWRVLCVDRLPPGERLSSLTAAAYWALKIHASTVGLMWLQRVEADGKWSLFCPNEAPGLAESWGADFTVCADLPPYKPCCEPRLRGHHAHVGWHRPSKHASCLGVHCRSCYCALGIAEHCSAAAHWDSVISTQ